MTDAELAAHLAQVAGRILVEVRDSAMFTGKALGKAGDETANQFLVHALREQRAEDGLLSEEMACDGARLTHSRVWIVDPVDGTREYGEERADWAVHVGLAIDGVPTRSHSLKELVALLAIIINAASAAHVALNDTVELARRESIKRASQDTIAHIRHHLCGKVSETHAPLPVRKALGPLRFEAGWRSFDGTSSTRVEERP